MTTFFLECYGEEIPSRFQKLAEEKLRSFFLAYFSTCGLTYETVSVFSTPRRLAIRLNGVPERVPETYQERKGPREDAPAQAFEGFLRTYALDRQACEVRDIPGKGRFWFGHIRSGGQDSSVLLAKAVQDFLHTMVWPKSMRWGSDDYSWVRPLQNVLAIFNGKQLHIELPHTYVKQEPYVRGHRFYGHAEIKVATGAEYESILEEAHVIASREEREEAIRKMVKPILMEKNIELKEDTALMGEVVGLVEYPCVLLGEIDAAFRSLPERVLESSIRTHQKYLMTCTRQGTLSPYFFIVANKEDTKGLIYKGNMKVLRARLRDAQFFLTQDQKVPLRVWADKLKGKVFHEKLGTVYDKCTRIASLLEKQGIDPSLGYIVKADLVTHMVSEFPELQGYMGSYYAKVEGMSEDVCAAIRDHYKPEGPGDALPESYSGAICAFVDKLDTLAGFFSIGIMPSGSKDPYALRRACLGVIRLSETHNLDIVMWFHHALSSYKVDDRKGVEKAFRSFLYDRLQGYYKDKGFSHDLICMLRGFSDNVQSGFSRLCALRKAMSPEFLQLIKRLNHILRGKDTIPSVDIGLFATQEEHDTHEVINNVDSALSLQLGAGNFDAAVESITSLAHVLDSFFEAVRIEDNNPAIRLNRYALLKKAQSQVERIACIHHI